jgi:hypothetical protein
LDFIFDHFRGEGCPGQVRRPPPESHRLFADDPPTRSSRSGETRARLDSLGLETWISSPEELARLQSAEVVKWALEPNLTFGAQRRRRATATKRQELVVPERHG